MLHQNMKS